MGPVASEVHIISLLTHLKVAISEEVLGGMILVMNQSLKMTCQYSKLNRWNSMINWCHLREIKEKKDLQDFTKVQLPKVDLSKDLHIDKPKQKVKQKSLKKNFLCSLSKEVSVLIILDGSVTYDQDFITSLAIQNHLHQDQTPKKKRTKVLC